MMRDLFKEILKDTRSELPDCKITHGFEEDKTKGIVYWVVKVVQSMSSWDPQETHPKIQKVANKYGAGFDHDMNTYEIAIKLNDKKK